MRMFRAVIFLLLSLSVSGFQYYASDSPNLVENSGFELGSGNLVTSWSLFGQTTWVTDEVHSGSRAIRAYAEGNNAGVASNFFQAPAHSRVEVSVWMKAQEVVSPGSWFKLRLVLIAFKEDQTTTLKHWDLISTEGSFLWKEVKGSVIVPPETKYMRLVAVLSNCTGTFWIDDVDARIIQTVPDVNLKEVETPVIIPEPWQKRIMDNQKLIGTVWIQNTASGEHFNNALQGFLSDFDLQYFDFEGGCPTPAFNTLFMIGDRSVPELTARLRNSFPGVSWPDLGDQGYFLSVDRKTIFIGANTDQGRFYALQTLKQIIDPQQKSVFLGEILDRPSLKLRGIPMGVQWFYEPQPVFSRMTELKLNFIWIQGTFINYKFLYQWRVPLNEGEKKVLTEFLNSARQNFLDPYISISPRGENETNSTQYSSASEIQLMVSKFEDLYGLGFRNFGISFDDLQNVAQDRLFGADVQFFGNDIGKAHAYFVTAIFQRLKENYPDIQFMVLPMMYSRVANLGDVDEAYLQSLSNLPPEIGFYSSPEYLSDFQTELRLTKQPHMIWDNFWARFYEGSQATPEFPIPLDRSTVVNHELATGFSFLPLLPTLEDASLVTWRTAASYAWSPERYDPERAFQSAAAKYLGVAKINAEFANLIPLEINQSGVNNCFYAPLVLSKP